MAPRSALARSQRRWLAAQLVACGAWLVGAGIWAGRWDWAAGGIVIALAWLPLLMLIQFAVVGILNRGIPERPRATELLRAWVSECGAVQRVFMVWQPFQWNRLPDLLSSPPGARGRHGVVLIHGYMCNRGLWRVWMEALSAQRRAHVAVNLEPVLGSIDDYAPIIDDAVRRVTEATGIVPILVCHSMGGLAARAWLRRTDPRRVAHVVTLGSPHAGTWWGGAGLSVNARQMRLQSRWLRALGLPGAGSEFGPRWTCFYSNVDNIVLPARVATLPGADNRLQRGVGHVELALHPAPRQWVVAWLEAADAARR